MENFKENRLGISPISGLILLWLRISYGYDNLSTGRTDYTWMSTVFDGIYPANLAVDGQFDKFIYTQYSCAISAHGQSEATWRIDLGDIRSIKSVKIYYRNDDPSDWDNSYRGRFAGFFLYASNTTSKEDGYLCYHKLQNGANSPPPMLTVSCVLHARYIIYYNERKPGITYPSYYYTDGAYVELCEVVVSGCNQTGVYGANCNMPCPTNCQERKCSVDIGACLGCVDGYTGITCERPCPDQHYGQECKKTCGNCLHNVACHHVNGSCLNGCSAGWKSDRCVIPCDRGRYGLQCSGICNVNCKISGVCNHITGACVGGCKNGYQGEKCDRECDGNMYGANCNTPCGTCIGHSQCHHINGSCLTGCDKGFKGNTCTTECEPTEYGEDCRYNCSIADCVNQTCNGQTGVCIQALHQNNDENLESSSVVPIIVGVFAPLVIFTILAVVLLLLKRKRKGKDSSAEGKINELFNMEDIDSHTVSKMTQNIENNKPKSEQFTRWSQTGPTLSEKIMTSTITAEAQDESEENVYQELHEDGIYERQYTACPYYSEISDIDINNVADANKLASKGDIERLNAEYPKGYQNYSQALSENIQNGTKTVYHNLQSPRPV